MLVEQKHQNLGATFLEKIIFTPAQVPAKSETI